MASAWAAFHFLRPAVLWALVPIAVYAVSLYLRDRTRSPWERAVEPRFLKHLMASTRLRQLVTPDVLLVPLAALAVIATAGPTWAPQPSADPAQSPLAIVMELSHSMAATDVSPSRAERARLELRDLVHARPTSPTALVVVAGTAHVLMPMTDDPAVLAPYLDALSPDLMPVDGSAFARVTRLLEPMASDAKAPLSVLLVSDGLPPDGADALAALHHTRGVGFVVLAVGTNDGDPAHGVPPVDRAGLRRFAASVDAELIDLTFGERDVRRILSAIALHRADAKASDDAEFWEDSAYLLAIPLALGIALWFRRGWALGQVAVLSLLALQGCSGHVLDLWLTRDQQGRLLFEGGRYQEAAARFEDPMWRGLSFYAQGKFADAAAAFAGVNSKEGLFNLGNAYAQSGKLGSALSAYERALTKAPTYRDARHNADLIREILQNLQEDTDLDDAQKAPVDSGDLATKLDADAIALKPLTDDPEEQSTEKSSEQLSPEEEAAWLRHVQTDPSAFLKRKLATLAARSSP